MKRAMWAAVFVAALALVVVGWSRDEAEPSTAVSAQPVREVPRFEVDPSWPKMPNGWILGLVASVNVDPEDNVWVLQRPRTLEPEEMSKVAPAVLQFDNDGNFDSGEFKRMWSAFGNVPVDGDVDPEWAKQQTGDGPPQFVSPVHGVKVSNDGLVYVADRGGKRVQVFTLDGEYLNQVWVGRECLAPECGNGTTAASAAFSPDPEQRFLYVGNRSQAKVMVFDRRTLELLDSFGRWGSAPGEFGTLHHMAADSKGNLYVTEVTPLKPENRRVQKFRVVQ